MTGTNESSPSFSFLRNLLADTLRQGTAPSQGPAPDLARCAFFFDLGVFCLVVGATMLILTALAHQSIRSHRVIQHADGERPHTGGA